MMPGCSSYEGGHVMGACSCGMFHSQTNSFPMLFGNSTNQYNPYDDHEYSDMYNSFTPSSSSVDCTLSLGTPSTRLTEDEEKRTSSSRSLCWDLLRSKHSHTNKSTRGSSSSSTSSNNDPLLARRCANCDTTSTPLWRNGPRGPKITEGSSMTLRDDED
ncbi:GATA transcription factor 18 [Senna tora]|uniref:GATA transcription factor 18 n=1 Tax=Senna tora TaxID=362788 RepID=A0A834W544_9FABA|nr:GATA transcription factor 18 [Senna tora]